MAFRLRANYKALGFALRFISHLRAATTSHRQPRARCSALAARIVPI